MMKPMTFWQKVVAYSSLAFVAFWTVFGVYVIWLILTDNR